MWVGVRPPLFVKGHRLRCGPQGANDPQNGRGLLRSVGYGFPWSLLFSANQGPVLFLSPIPKSKELWELCFLYKIPKQGVLQRRESSGQTQGLDLAL